MARTPTHSEVTRFISSLLPPRANDVSLLYHVPRRHGYNFETHPVEQVVLSVTPTQNFYHAIGDPDEGARAGTADRRQHSEEARPPHTIGFLHRPFTLDRRRVRKDILVLASHTSFDEHLTVGWNQILAERLGIKGSGSVCVQGFKDDADRRVGLIGRVSMILGPLLRSIEKEFGEIEHAQEGLSEEIQVVALMNAFNNDQVHRVLDLAQERGWVPSVEPIGRHVLYLTGQPRESGLAAAKEVGMTVVCVGHRVAEQWGIAYMAAALRTTFSQLQVKEIYEDGLPDGHLDGHTDGHTDGLPDGLSDGLPDGLSDGQGD